MAHATASGGRLRPNRLIDVMFGALVVATVVYWVSLTPQSWVFIDDWKLASQARTIPGIFAPYNGHLSIVILAIYRIVLEIFGYSTYLPFRIVGAVCLAAVGASMYFTTRRQIGTPLAIVVGALFLWPRNITMEVCALNHWLALVGGIFVAGFLNRSESNRVNVWLAVALCFSLASADGGVAVGVAGIAFCFLTRPSWKRWAAVTVPFISWVVWWLAWGRRESTKFVDHLTISDKAHLLVTSIVSSTTLLTFGHRVSGWILLVLFLARLAMLLRHGISRAANLVAWTAALVVWWGGVVWFRSGGFTINTFRYNYLSAGFIVLALIPTEPLRWRLSNLPVLRSLRIPAVATIAMVLLLAASSLLFFTTTRASTHRAADVLNAQGPNIKATSIQVDKGPQVVPDGQNLGMFFYSFNAGQIRELFAFYGGMPKS